MFTRILYAMLIFVPVTLVGEFVLHWGATELFILSAIAIVPLAKLIGDATEELAIHTGPRIGGLLNATLGNGAELIITIFPSVRVYLIWYGHLSPARSSVTCC